MMNWLLLAFFAGLFSNLVHIFMRYTLRDNEDPTPLTWLMEAVRVIGFGVWAIYDWRLEVHMHSMLIFGGLGLTEIFTVYLMGKMHSLSELSISSLISRSRVIWVALLAFIFLGEVLTLSEYLGIFVMFVGLSFASSPKKIMMDAGVRYAYGFAIGAAAINIFLRVASTFASVPVVMLALAVPPTIMMPFLMRGNGFKRIAEFMKTSISMKMLTGFWSFLSIYFLTSALAVGNVSKVSSIQQAMMILPIAFGIIFFKERKQIGMKILGTILTLIGVYVMTLS